MRRLLLSLIVILGLTGCGSEAIVIEDDRDYIILLQGYNPYPDASGNQWWDYLGYEVAGAGSTDELTIYAPAECAYAEIVEYQYPVPPVDVSGGGTFDKPNGQSVLVIQGCEGMIVGF